MKMKKHLLAALFTTLAVGSSSAATMVAYYTFDDANDIGKNSADNANTDWNGFGVTQNADAKFGTSSGNFYNDAWDNDFGTDTGIDLSSFSVSMHVKGGANNAWHDYMSIGTGGNTVHVLEQTNTGAVANYNVNTVGGDGGQAGPYDNINVTDGNWHHIGMTVGNNTVTLYVDGVARASADYTGSGTPTAFQIGARFGAGRAMENALIDDVSVWDGALTATEMATLSSNAATSVPEPSSTALIGLGGLALILRRRK